MNIDQTKTVATITISDTTTIKSQSNLLVPNNQLTKKTIHLTMTTDSNKSQLQLVHTNLLKALDDVEMKANMDRVPRIQA